MSVIEDWSKQLPEFDQPALPPAAANAAFLLEDFIFRHQGNIADHRQGRRDRSYLKRFAAILFKLTAAAESSVEQMLIAAADLSIPHGRWTDKHTLESIRDYAINGVMADQLCKFFPDYVVQIAKEEWKAEEKTRRPGSLMAMIESQPDIDDFGLNEDIKYDLDFPSAYQSFIYWLFLYHPIKALDFFIPFVNTALAINYQILAGFENDGDTFEITFADGSVQRYFGNYEYWVMYRGINTRNRLLASLLMGIEKSLLDLASSDQGNFALIKSYIARLIKESNNIAILGMVAGVLQAFPNLLDEVSVFLLSVPQFYRWDGNRNNAERLDLGNYIDDPLQKKERTISDGLGHRTKYYQGLIGFVADYMFYYGTQNPLLFEIVDRMWAAAPEDADLWRKFLFYMDARKYKPQPLPGYDNYVQLVPGYDKGVEDMMTDYKESALFPPSLSSFWALQVFDGKEVKDNSYETWKNIYQSLQEPQERIDHFMSYPGTLATVGLELFFDDLAPEEVKWCQDMLLKKGLEQLKPRDLLSFNSNVMDVNPPMKGLSLIFKSKLDPATEMAAKKLIFRLLISKIEEQPKIYLAAGIANNLSTLQPDFARDCWFGLLKFIEREKSNHLKAEQKRRELIEEFGFIRPEQTLTDDQSWRNKLINSVANGSIKMPELIITSLDISTHWFQDDALRIIPVDTTLEQQRSFIKGLLHEHVTYLGNKKVRYRNDFHDSRHAFTFFYARYLLSQDQEYAGQQFTELLNSVLVNDTDTDQKEVNDFIYDLVKEHVSAVNSGFSLPNFWNLWERLRVWMLETKRPIFFPLFLMDMNWNETSESWFVLNGREGYYKEFILNYGFNLINVTIRFLSGIAFNQFMPESISWVASILNSPNADQTDLALGDKFVRKAFYKYGSPIKENSQLRAAFIFILDFLITKGSSIAFMMKEELIQYK